MIRIVPSVHFNISWYINYTYLDVTEVQKIDPVGILVHGGPRAVVLSVVSPEGVQPVVDCGVAGVRDQLGHGCSFRPCPEKRPGILLFAYWV